MVVAAASVSAGGEGDKGGLFLSLISPSLSEVLTTADGEALLGSMIVVLRLLSVVLVVDEFQFSLVVVCPNYPVAHGRICHNKSCGTAGGTREC